MLYFIAQAASDAANSGSGGGISEDTQILTCSGLDCSVCSLMQMVVNLFYYLTWYIAFPIAVLFLIIGGFIYIGSRGNETWMSFAKRGIMYTIGGFMVSILAFVAINTIIQVMGGTDSSVWSKMECGSDSTSKLKNLQESKVADLVNSIKNGGQLSGKLASNTSANEILKLMNNLDSTNMLVFESELKGNRKALMAVGEKDDQPQLLYIDRSMINSILSDKQTGLLKINEANASESQDIDDVLQQLVTEISLVTAKIIASNHDLFVVYTGKPNKITVSAILDEVNDVNQCIDSGGDWYGFSDLCTSQKQSCSAVKCTPTGDNLVASCKCPDNHCLENGHCVKKK